MVAVQLSGGLGNQMFEYALYLKLKSLGKEVKIDDFTCYGPGERRKMLDVFGVSYERLSREEYIGLTDSGMRPDQRIRRKLFGRKNLSYREKSSNFDPEVFVREPALFLGYYQSEKYFADITGQVREAFRFRNFAPDARMRAMEERILGCASVSVHIRRGDYLDPEHRALYQGICTDAYYASAIARMRQMVPGAAFFFFSNDPEWVRKKYAAADFVMVEGNGEDAGYADLYLMSRCRHHILANSSFSWWGAWLNEDPGKRVIAPKRWLNVDPEGINGVREACVDIYTKEMIVL